MKEKRKREKGRKDEKQLIFKQAQDSVLQRTCVCQDAKDSTKALVVHLHILTFLT